MSTEQDVPSRRHVLLASAGVAGAATLATSATPAFAHTGAAMPVKAVTSKDGTSIFYKDWGKGQPIVFSHGWPLSADAWDAQMLFFVQHGYRVIAHDRRSHGRSSQTSEGNDMDTYADDLENVLAKLDVKDAVMIGHSTGGGEVTRYLGKYGNKRVKKAVLIGAIPPIMVKSDKNPGGLPLSVFDGIRSGVAGGRSQFYKELVMPFYGFNRAGTKLLEGVRDNFWLQGMMGGIKGQYECIKVFSETDLTEDLKKIDIPVLLLHGEDDQIVPLADSAQLGVKLLKKGTLKTYPGYPHGMAELHPEQINKDILEFIKA